jgi:RNA polymerase sigma factor (sigma-70 family)
MTGGIIVIKNTLFEGYEGPRLSPAAQMRRLRRVMEAELTEKQRAYMEAYFFQDQKMRQIAKTYGVAPSTVCRTLQRAVYKCRRSLKY